MTILRPKTPPEETRLDQREDEELTRLAALGDRDAFEMLWIRHHQRALRAVRPLAKSDTEDVVAEAYAEIWQQLQRGSTPPHHFKSYLITVCKNVASRQHRTKQHTVTGLELEDLPKQPLTPASSVMIEARDERRHIIAAFRSLPKRWQQTLWLTTIEKLPRKHIAATLGLSPNAVSAIAVRAKEGLRIAWLEQHLPPPGRVDHEHIVSSLPQYIRNALTTHNSNRVAQHLSSCHPCRTIHADLQRENQRLRRTRGGALVFVALTAAGSAVAPDLPAAAASSTLPSHGLITKAQSLITQGGTSLITAGTVGVVALSAAVGAVIGTASLDDATPSGGPSPRDPALEVLLNTDEIETPPPEASAPTREHSHPPQETSASRSGTHLRVDTEVSLAELFNTETLEVDNIAPDNIAPDKTTSDTTTAQPPQVTVPVDASVSNPPELKDASPASHTEPSKPTEPSDPSDEVPEEHLPFTVREEPAPLSGVPPIIHGTAPPSSDILVAVARETVVTVSDEDGNWAIDLSLLDLAVGSHSAVFTADASGESVTVWFEVVYPTLVFNEDSRWPEIHGLPHSTVCLWLHPFGPLRFDLGIDGVRPLALFSPDWWGNITLRYCDGDRLGPKGTIPSQ